MSDPRDAAGLAGRGGRRNVLRGIVRLALGRSSGLAEFAGTREAFLTSLIPLILLPLLGEALSVLGGNQASPIDLLVTICALLAPPVISHALARWWAREAEWPRFAVAFNWCQWVIPAAACILLLGSALLIGLGAPNEAVGEAWVLALAAYGFWLHWFLARHALALPALRAALLVVIVNFGTVALVIGPLLAVRLLVGGGGGADGAGG